MTAFPWIAGVRGEIVADGKPHPEGYFRAVELLGAAPADTLAFEDTEAGVVSAKATFTASTRVSVGRLGSWESPNSCRGARPERARIVAIIPP